MVFILGWNHCLQYYDLMEQDPDLQRLERNAKAEFYETGKGIVRKELVRFIGEECWPHGKLTLAKAIAGELNVSYDEIDLCIDERRRRGIPDDYKQRNAAERARGFAIREDYMLERTYAKSHADTPKLIVCGADHLPGLTIRFLGYEETITRDLTKGESAMAFLERKRTAP